MAAGQSATMSALTPPLLLLFLISSSCEQSLLVSCVVKSCHILLWSRCYDVMVFPGGLQCYSGSSGFHGLPEEVKPSECKAGVANCVKVAGSE